MAFLDERKDYYLNVYMCYGVALDSGLGIDFGAAAGYAAGYAGEYAAPGGESGFQEYTLTLGLGYEISDMILVSATLGYTDVIDDDVLPE